MLFINHFNTNSYFNHAAEQYVLENFNDECFMLWRNEPCILIGKNQNALAEINMDYIKEKNITVVRRLTGGGAVFNDLGNINFTFIAKNTEDVSSNFRKFTNPLLKALQALGVNAEFSGRNDLVIEGKKFSGNAQYYHKDKVLHHGTLLFSSSMTDLSKALKVNPLKLKDKGVKSVSSRVTNISEHLREPMTVLEFKNYVIDFVMKIYGEKNLYEFNNEDLKVIAKIVEERFSNWDWNFGHSPKYTYSKQKRFKGGTLEISFDVRQGYITKLKFYGDFFFTKDIKELEEKFIQLPHEENAIKEFLNNNNIEEYIKAVEPSDILELMF
ncbi:lipoate--protein ligase [Hathewaya massiliensis]|uniref:lipoate--protein ligase n=1 Tax=Hathewaya massiliensis TaxID=1964382 RepID=UPI0011574B36|nr:lipoate--protein ligase [Hathewaya massiliensis]